jgi:hypothetical protein
MTMGSFRARTRRSASLPNHLVGPSFTLALRLYRVGSRRLRAETLPHHRTCRFRHPAVEPGEGRQTAATCHGMMKP